VFASLHPATHRSLIDDRSGTSVVEFALIFPVFVILLFGIAKFAYAQHCASSLHFALRTASRSLMLDPSMNEGQLEAMVKADLTVLGDPDVDVTLAVSDNGNGRVAKLTGRYEYAIDLPLLETFPVIYVSTVSTALPDVPG